MEDSRPSIDIFKAIFASDESDSSDSSGSDHDADKALGTDAVKKGVDNSDFSGVKMTTQSPKSNQTRTPQKLASGIFANIDFDAVNEVPSHMLDDLPENVPSKADDVDRVEERAAPAAYYGPALPPADGE